MTVSKITSAPTPNEQINKINEIIDNLGSGGTATDVQVNGTSITSNGVANIVTNTAYNSSTNKIATMSDISGKANTSLSNLNSTGNNLVNTALNTNDNTTRLKFWTGTKAQYNAITTKDSNTLYNITDDTDISLTLLQTIYPVGSVYLSTNATCPLASLFGTWTLVSSGKALWTGTGSNGGSTIEAGLPNITGQLQFKTYKSATNDSGAFYEVYYENKVTPSGGDKDKNVIVDFDASRSNPIYGNSTTVQPPAYVVNVWRRTA